MIERQIKLNKNNHLILLGPRGSGKSTLIRAVFTSNKTLWIDLLTDEDEDRFGRNPDELSYVLSEASYDYVVIDEVQKFPKLLDVVHREIENPKHKTIFILSGSSARKLRRGHANLLAGRLFMRELYPFTHFELAEEFTLKEALNWGTLPRLRGLNEQEKFLFLRSYVKTYIKEEVLVEQLIRSSEAFYDFLPIAAQANGKIINYSKIARQVGINDNTVRSYFQILEDTLIGFYLPSFHRSIRKRQRQAPKFYFFDLGVKKALEGTLKVEYHPKTSDYGHAFEHFIILECFRLNEYFLSDFQFSYFMDKESTEIDLIIERPGEEDLLVEIKSTTKVQADLLKPLLRIQKEWDKKCTAHLWSNDKHSKNINGVHCLHWQEGLKRIFLPQSTILDT